MGAMIECELFEREGVTGALESGERHDCLQEKGMAPMQGAIASESRVGGPVLRIGRGSLRIAPQGLGGDVGAERYSQVSSIFGPDRRDSPPTTASCDDAQGGTRHGCMRP